MCGTVLAPTGVGYQAHRGLSMLTGGYDMFTKSRLVRQWAALLVVVATLGLAGQGRAEMFQPFPTDATNDRAAILAAIANVPAGAGVVYDGSGRTDDIEIWNFGTLVYRGPFDVSSTLDRIRHDDWMNDPNPGTLGHQNDGIFHNLR